MPFQCLSEEIAVAPVPMDVTPTQRMMSACAGVLATSLVVTPMGECLISLGTARRESAHSKERERKESQPSCVSRAAARVPAEQEQTLLRRRRRRCACISFHRPACSLASLTDSTSNRDPIAPTIERGGVLRSIPFCFFWTFARGVAASICGRCADSGSLLHSAPLHMENR